MNEQDSGNVERGSAIPAKYRNRLYAWEGGGYDGCLWEPNFGLVDNAGNWDPFCSTGANGLDRHRKDREETEDLKRRFGYPPDADPEVDFQRKHDEAYAKACRKYYGERPLENREYVDPDSGAFLNVHAEEVDAYVLELLGDEVERHRACCARRRELDERRHRELNGMFMEQVALQEKLPEGSRPWDIRNGARAKWKSYSLDPERIDEACGEFCRDYGDSVGTVADVLDYLEEVGYRVCCTCSDCGRQFRLRDVDRFCDCIDTEAYRGNSGVGCTYTRILCEDCQAEALCPLCGHYSRPSSTLVRKGGAYDSRSVYAGFLAQWVGVCPDCADSFFHEAQNRHWRDEIDRLRDLRGAAIDQLGRYLDALRESGTGADDLKRIREKSEGSMRRDWVALENGLRDRMQHDVAAYYRTTVGGEVWPDDRIDKEDTTYEF